MNPKDVTETPETDAEIHIVGETEWFTGWLRVKPDFARKLEKERDQWKAMVSKLESEVTSLKNQLTINQNHP
jgi:hypothetical protein